MYRSTDAGAHWTGPSLVEPVVAPGVGGTRRPVMDGVADGRDGLNHEHAAAPSVPAVNPLSPLRTPATPKAG